MTMAGDFRTVILADSALAALLGERVYPVRLPQKPSYPLLLLTRVSDEKDRTLDGTSRLRQARIQIDCKAETQVVAAQIADELERLLDGKAASGGDTRFASCWITRRDERFEEGTETYRSSLDFEISYWSTAP